MIFGQSQEFWDASVLVLTTAGSAFGSTSSSDGQEVLWLISTGAEE